MAAMCEEPPLWLDDALKSARQLLRYSWPVGLVTLLANAMVLVDLGVVGHVLGAGDLAGVCLCHLLVNLTQEPACFILTNTLTTLCADAFHSHNYAHRSRACKCQ